MFVSDFEICCIRWFSNWLEMWSATIL